MRRALVLMALIATLAVWGDRDAPVVASQASGVSVAQEAEASAPSIGDGIPQGVVVASIGQTVRTLYRIEIPPSYFIQGSGRAEVHGSRIRLSDVAPENGRATIKFHWFERLRTHPPRVIEPVYMLDDPIPFISVIDPPREFEIFDDFGRSHPGR